MTPFKDISSWGPYPMVWLRWGMKDRPFLDNSEGCESPKVPCGIGWGCPWAPHLPYSFPVQLLPSLPVTGIHLTNPSYESTYILNCVSKSAFGKSRPWAEWIGQTTFPRQKAVQISCKNDHFNSQLSVLFILRTRVPTYLIQVSDNIVQFWHGAQLPLPLPGVLLFSLC